MKLTRKELLVGGAAGAALGAAGIYELVDKLADSPPSDAAAARAPEQHLLDGMRVEKQEGVEVVVPPLHHEVVTARVVAPRGPAARRARVARPPCSPSSTPTIRATPDGLGVTVAWGLPYFQTLRAGRRRRAPPVRPPRRSKPALLSTRSASRATPTTRSSRRTTSRSSSAATTRSTSRTAATAIADRMKARSRVTSIRKGFAGGGFDGGKGLPKEMAMAAGVAGRRADPRRLGALPRLHVDAEERARAAADRQLRDARARRPRAAVYFHGGTHMHLSHIFEDLEAWYLNFDFRERVDTAFRPRLPVQARGRRRCRSRRSRVASEQRGRAATTTASARSATARRSSRPRGSQQDIRGTDGTLYPKGTAIPQRADFNTLDNPFFWSADPKRDRMGEGPAAGLHFVVFNPTSDDFHRNRLAMDGVLPGRRRSCRFVPRAPRPGLQLDPADDAPAELPRPAAAPPLVPARRVD